MAASAIGGKRALRPLAACDLPSRSSAGVRGSGVRAAAAPHSGHQPRPWGSEDGCQEKKKTTRNSESRGFHVPEEGHSAQQDQLSAQQLQLQSESSASGPELRVQSLAFTFCESSGLWGFTRVPHHYCSLWGSSFIPTYTRFPR